MSTKEKQYNKFVEDLDRLGHVKLGVLTSDTYRRDPKRLGFLLSRYKFVSRMFTCYSNILEVGCGDGFGTQLVANVVGDVDAIDFDEIFVKIAKDLQQADNINFYVHNPLRSPFCKEKYDGIYSLDVLEHIAPKDEDKFIKNTISSLKKEGSLIIGMPSLESQPYASPVSREGHVNCKSSNELKLFLLSYFNNVFMFGMNDEVLHTGYDKMQHYIIALCVNKKISNV